MLIVVEGGGVGGGEGGGFKAVSSEENGEFKVRTELTAILAQMNKRKERADRET